MRALSWWISWGDLEIGNSGIRDKILCRADEFAKSNADTAVLFGAHFRWDFLPYWDALHWYLRQTADALHERGIKLFDHVSSASLWFLLLSVKFISVCSVLLVCFGF